MPQAGRAREPPSEREATRSHPCQLREAATAGAVTTRAPSTGPRKNTPQARKRGPHHRRAKATPAGWLAAHHQAEKEPQLKHWVQPQANPQAMAEHSAAGLARGESTDAPRHGGRRQREPERRAHHGSTRARCARWELVWKAETPAWRAAGVRRANLCVRAVRAGARPAGGRGANAARRPGSSARPRGARSSSSPSTPWTAEASK